MTFDDGYRSVFELARPILLTLSRFQRPCSSARNRSAAQRLFWFDAVLAAGEAEVAFARCATRATHVAAGCGGVDAPADAAIRSRR